MHTHSARPQLPRLRDLPLPLNASWLDPQGKPLAQPQAWLPGRLQIPWPLPGGSEQLPWQSLRLRLAGRQLPLYRRQQQRTLYADWPSLEPGVYPLELSSTQTEQACQHWQARVFVCAPPLDQAQWFQLLQELRYELPYQLLSHPLRTAQVPVQPGPLPLLNLERECQLWQHWLQEQPLSQGSATTPATPATVQRWGLLSALRQLAFTYREDFRLQAQVVPPHQLRQLQPQSLWQWQRRQPLLQQWQAQRQRELPENQLVASLLPVVLHSLNQLQGLISQLPQPPSAPLQQALTQSQRQLSQLWQHHPLQAVKPLQPGQPLPQPSQPASAFCLELWHWLQTGGLPNAEGRQQLPFRHFGLLYQYWCSLQLIKTLLDAALAEGWQLQALHWEIRSAQPLLHLQKGQLRLQLWAEKTFMPAQPSPSPTALYSLSRVQRPDLCLLLSGPSGQCGLVFDAKFRQQHKQPLKEDIDRLHAYRDAIYAGPHPLFSKAILLYPGETQDYGNILSAWQALPGSPLNWPVKDLLKQLQNNQRSSFSAGHFK